MRTPRARTSEEVDTDDQPASTAALDAEAHCSPLSMMVDPTSLQVTKAQSLP